jgi:hypothetical protein
MLKKAVHVLPAVNIRETIDFYEGKLGFTGLNFGTYAILKYKGIEIHFVLSAEKNKSHGTGCLIMVDNIQYLYLTISGKILI